MPTQNIFDLVDTWNDGATTFTAIKMNVTDTASNASSLLMDLQVGGAGKFNVRKDGSTYITNGIVAMGASGGGPLFISTVAGAVGYNMASVLGVGWTNSTTNAIAAPDTILTRRAAANLRLGAADAAAPVAQTLSVQSITGTNASAAAYPFKITGAQGTGNAAGGSIIFQVAPAGGAGAAQNTPVDALTINSERNLVIRNGGYIRTEGAQPNSGIRIGGNGFNEPILATEWVNTGATAFSTGRSGAGNSWLAINSTAVFGWGNGTDLGTGTPVLDVSLYRDAANTLALRNDTAGQEFRVYDTYTSGSNYRRLTLGNGGGAGVIVSVNGAGAGNTGSLYLRANTSGGTLEFGTASTDRWRMDASGHFLAIADNLYDIGASGGTRPRNVYVAGLVYSSVETPNSGYIKFGAEGRLSGTGSDGIFRLQNNAGTDFGRLQFGGFTSSFPALKRSSTTLQARLADDSAFASVQGKLTTDTNYTAGTFTATGYLTLYDAAGTAYRVPCAV